MGFAACRICSVLRRKALSLWKLVFGLSKVAWKFISVELLRT